jgi:hypothetical protein
MGKNHLTIIGVPLLYLNPLSPRLVVKLMQAGKMHKELFNRAWLPSTTSLPPQNETRYSRNERQALPELDWKLDIRKESVEGSVWW